VHRPPENTVLQHQPWRQRLRSKAGWADSATYTMSDLTMLRKELVIGYVVAGFLTVLVPARVWNTLFLQGHGFWTTLENVIVGPFIAIISFVCSVGNVPLAAALWRGGISFGGVIAFIFADLIAIPLLLIYRRYYGFKLMLKMLALFWLVMSLAGLTTEGLFRVAGLVPTSRPSQIVSTSLQWNYTTVLNIIFLFGFGALSWTYRNRERLGGGRGYAIDPVCGMQVEAAHAPASCERDGMQIYFCSDRCREKFEKKADSIAGATPRSHEPTTVTLDSRSGS
jgi:YHS domain-containing protein